jgi:hypothetical protein
MRREAVKRGENFSCMRTALQYVNDNFLRKEMKNGAAFKCDVRAGEGTLLFMCKASEKEKKVGFWL